MGALEVETATLYRLLGRCWTVGSGVTSLAFDNAGDAVAFALADGGLAIAPLADAESPQARCRVGLDDGRATLLPRQKPVPPLIMVAIGDVPVHLSALGESGFVVGDRDRLLRISASGITDVFSERASRIDLVAPMPTGGVLMASGGTVIGYDAAGEAVWSQQRAGYCASALSVAADGRRYAVVIDGGLLIRSVGPRPGPTISFDLGAVTNLAWSPDASWLAASVAAGIVFVRASDGRIVRIPGYPHAVGSVSWTPDSRLLVTGGAYRVLVWDVTTIHDDSERPKDLATGRAGFVAVETVDVHPERPLVAAGYSDGRVMVTKIGTAEELMAKPPGGGAVRALKWSRDGQHLALGTGDGEAAVVTFPSQVFK